MEVPKFSINMDNLMNSFNELEPREVALLIIIAEFHRPVTEDEVFEKVQSYGLDKMTDEEVMQWINEWRKKKSPMFLN
jgi:hypothetical protein